MAYKKILTIQDISCVGQCSLTVALPILSACGLETCILPSAVLSTHTGGFSGFTFRDLTDDMPAIQAHWQKENIKFKAIYTGYLGSTKQIEYVEDIFESTASENCVKIVDPAMADNGKLYPAFDEAFAKYDVKVGGLNTAIDQFTVSDMITIAPDSMLDDEDIKNAKINDLSKVFQTKLKNITIKDILNWSNITTLDQDVLSIIGEATLEDFFASLSYSDGDIHIDLVKLFVNIYARQNQ